LALDGNDVIYPKTGSKTIDGGSGVNTLDYTDGSITT